MPQAGRSSSVIWYRPLAVFATLILATATIYWGRAVLIPIALAVLLTFLLSPAVHALQRRGLGRVFASILVVSLAFLFIAGIGSAIFLQVSALAEDLPLYTENLTQKLADLKEAGHGGVLDNIQRFIRDVNVEVERKSPSTTDPTKPLPMRPMPVAVQSSETSEWAQTLAALEPFFAPLASAGLVVVLVIFGLIKREDLRNRLIRLAGRTRLTVTTRALDEAGQRISRYLLMQLIVNGTFGTAIAIGLFLIGMPYAFLWGFFAAVLRYIPYLGPWLAAAFPVALSLLAFPNWTEPLLVVGLFLVCELLSNLVMEPMLYGRSAGVSEVALLVVVAFWTWLWGPIGLILATPLTTCLVVLGKYVPQLEFLDILLGAEPALEPHLSLYQRLLARDQDEASDLVEEHLEAKSWETVYDELLIPALVLSKKEHERDRLSADDQEGVARMAADVLEETLGPHVHAAVESHAEEQAHESQVALPRALVLGCPARDDTDEVALRMFQQLLRPRCDVEVVTDDLLSSEVVSLVQEKKPALICVASLPPGGLAHTRYLCKRLRSRFSELKILVGRWGLDARREHVTQTLQAAGADQVGFSLQESRDQALKLIQLLPHLQPVAVE